MVSFFNRLGLATLAYDKRGCGNSGGDWKKVDLEDLAGDALAGVKWLRAQAAIDPRKVGLWGISHGTVTVSSSCSAPASGAIRIAANKAIATRIRSLPVWFLD